MEPDNDDDTEKDTEKFLIERSREEVTKSGARPELLEALIGAISEARVSREEAHPWWPYRHALVALYRSYEPAGRSEKMIRTLRDKGFAVPDNVQSPRGMGRYMNRLCEAVDREIGQTNPEKKPGKSSGKKE